MAQVSNTYETFDAVGNREDLANTIWDITPSETPFLSLIGKKKVESVHPEWQTDTLATPDTTNNHPEGDDWTYDALTPTVRVGNYTQISNKRFLVSRTQDKTSKAGRQSELAYQTMKNGKELKTDMEVIVLSNQASSAGAGNGATNRKLGALRAWLSTNDDIDGGGASGGFNTGTGVVDAASNGSQRAFTKAIMDSVILNTYNAGGNPSTIMVSPYVKTVFSNFMDNADVIPLRQPVKGSGGRVTIMAAADAYQSDFGTLLVVPNRQMARAGATIARNAFFIDPAKISLGVFDDIMLEKPATTGDATTRVLICEYTLYVHNEAAHGVAADLYGLTAST